MIYYNDDIIELHHGKMQDELQTIEPESIDAIVTDPPYELNFMNKGWDNSGVAFQKETWGHCFKVLKKGGYLLAFGGSRTYHRICCAIEDAGFEIRDCIMWLYKSGFPKSMNIGLMADKKQGCPNRGHRIAVANRYHPDGTLEPNGELLERYEAKTELGKMWKGWGTALKPAYEPVIVARKPFAGSLIDNIIENGVGGLNIDECRVGTETVSIHNAPSGTFAGGDYDRGSDTESYRESIGRFPANVITDGSEEVERGFPNTKSSGGTVMQPKFGSGSKGTYNLASTGAETFDNGYVAPADEGSAMRYFYCAKASKKDRDEGLDGFDEISTGELQGGRKEGSAGSVWIKADGTTRTNAFAGNGAMKKNPHPTVKPTELMQYLVRLVAPKGATILDPFMGSGSTGKAVMYENAERNANYKFVGVEMTAEYLPIAQARIQYAKQCADDFTQLSFFESEDTQ